ncbi:MAG: hypothetical protein AB7I18_09100 [Candidatus Berkiella sp.]
MSKGYVVFKSAGFFDSTDIVVKAYKSGNSNCCPRLDIQKPWPSHCSFSPSYRVMVKYGFTVTGAQIYSNYNEAYDAAKEIYLYQGGILNFGPKIPALIVPITTNHYGDTMLDLDAILFHTPKVELDERCNRHMPEARLVGVSKTHIDMASDNFLHFNGDQSSVNNEQSGAYIQHTVLVESVLNDTIGENDQLDWFDLPSTFETIEQDSNALHVLSQYSQIVQPKLENDDGPLLISLVPKGLQITLEPNLSEPDSLDINDIISRPSTYLGFALPYSPLAQEAPIPSGLDNQHSDILLTPAIFTPELIEQTSEL